MTVQKGDSTLSSFRYTGQRESSEGTSGSAEDARSEEHVEEVTADAERNQIPGLETTASACFKRANQIARSLNHSNLSTDHLMLALTMDQNARRLIERVGEVAQLREAAMQKLGKNYTKSSRDVGNQPLPPTSDLADLAKAAREAAAEREQLIAISDLINAFPRANGRLVYGTSEVSSSAVIDSIKILVPKVDDAVTRIEGAVRDAIQQQHQSVHKVLEDLSLTQIERAEQRQREFMEDTRRQVREMAQTEIAAALKAFRLALLETSRG